MQVILQLGFLIHAGEDDCNLRLVQQPAQAPTDEQAMQAPAFFLLWSGEAAYSYQEIVRYNDQLYRCIAKDGVQPNPTWMPDVAPSLWVRIADPAIEWPDWEQPTSGPTAYAMGAKVTHKGKRWISKIDANTTEPGSDPRWWEEQA